MKIATDLSNLAMDHSLLRFDISHGPKDKVEWKIKFNPKVDFPEKWARIEVKSPIRFFMLWIRMGFIMMTPWKFENCNITITRINA